MGENELKLNTAVSRWPVPSMLCEIDRSPHEPWI